MLLAATPIISEFLASNSGGLRDSDGESSDWIEIFNPTAAPVDLANWTLTDDAGDLNQWSFPPVIIQPDAYLVVFASGQDRAVEGEQLHTNFRLSSGGEFLALAQPDGTIVSQFAPSYPVQNSNISFGPTFIVDSFVQPGAAATVLVPTDGLVVDGTAGATWQSAGYDDDAWIDGVTGIGFGVNQPGFDVRYVKARSTVDFNGEVTSLAIAETVLATPAQQSLVVESTYPTINFLGSGGNGNFDGDVPFPTQEPGDDINHFVVEAVSMITIPTAGPWSFGVNSDDGFGLTLTNGAETFTSSFVGTRPDRDTIATFAITQPGEYQLRLVAFEAAGGSSAELFAAQGSFATFAAGDFRLIGEVGGLTSQVPYIPGDNDFVATDIQAAMQGVGSTAAIRIAFDATSVMDINTLSLSVRYADGFVAYINGTEVARRGAPVSLAFDSTATSQRDAESILQVERINLDVAASSLVVGTNVLAIHSLNDSINDGTFLVLPELTATRVLQGQNSYFATPTPGEPNRDAVLGLIDRAAADLPAGFYDSPQTVTLSTTSPGASIRYTTDGTTPTATNGVLYTGPIAITSTTNLRAVAYQAEYASQPSITRTYLFLDDVLTQSNDGLPPPGFPATWKTNVVDYGIDPEVVAAEGAERVKDALKALPTWSITTELDNLFDPEIGIYSNAQQDGRDWERPAAVELINPDGAAGFQVNAGLRIRGGFSRSDNNPKHALKLFFRGSYGDASLNYPVHGNAGVSEFEKMDLRTAQNYSWSFQGDGSNNFVSEVMARYNQRDLGQPYTRSSWIHLYLNGQYWGLYQTQERADANFGASYFGGDASDYDVLKPERGAYQLIATDGNFDAYEALWQQAAARASDGITPAFVDHAAYLRAQGKNPDGTENPDFDVLLDVDNTIAYMIETIRGGNLDAPISNFLGNNRPNNYFAIRDRTGREGFRFIQHDAEHTHRNLNENRNGPYNHPNFEGGVEYFNPQWLHQQLMANDEYRLRFADKVQWAFFDDGPLTADAQIALMRSEAAKIDLAVVAESARWGDAKRAVPLGRANFLNALDNLEQNYFPQRSNIVINQFRNTQLVLKDTAGNYTVNVPAPLFPSIDAPRFLIDGQFSTGGEVPAGSELAFVSPDGVVVYTTDGSDPRLFGGGIHPDALTYDPMPVQTTAIATGSSWRYRDTGEDLGDGWRDAAFDDSGWVSGDAELGYGDGDETTVIGFGDPNNKFITTYFRRDFMVDAAGGEVSGATIRLRRDDGAAVHINGVEVLRDNLPAGPLSFNTPALTAVGGANETTYFEFSIDPSVFQFGSNVIAVEIHQSSGTSSDVSFDTELIIDQQQAPPVVLTQAIRLAARTLAADGGWSAIEEAVFTVPLPPATAANLRITEVHYNPADPPDGLSPPLDDDQNYEFIELRNISGETISLQGVRFTQGITFDFATSDKISLQSGEVIVLAKVTAALEARYGAGLPIVGEFAGNLSNGGETLTIVAADDSIIQSFQYDDSGADWHPSTDGGGPSLTVVRTGGDYNAGINWRPSFVVGGTPGVEENDAPDDISPKTAAVAENQPGALVAVLVANDPDDFETLTISLLPGGDAAWFELVGNELRVGDVGLDFEAAATRSITLRVTDKDGAILDEDFLVTVDDVVENATIVGRHIAYAGSAAAYGPLAIATDVTPLLPGNDAVVANVTGYVRGLNRIVIDVDGLTATTLATSDFAFRVGNSNDLSTWTTAPAPQSIDVLPGMGVDGSARVVITWGNNVIENQWLETTVLASGHVSPAVDDVFYFGNQVADTNAAAAGELVRVNGLDVLRVRFNQSPTVDVDITNDFDVDRNGKVNGLDTLFVRNRQVPDGQLLMLSLVSDSDDTGNGGKGVRPRNLGMPAIGPSETGKRGDSRDGLTRLNSLPTLTTGRMVNSIQPVLVDESGLITKPTLVATPSRPPRDAITARAVDHFFTSLSVQIDRVFSDES